MATDASHEQIERRAYELYEQRGRQHGRDWDDWFEAERDIANAQSAATLADQPRAARTNRRRPDQAATPAIRTTI